MSKMDIKIWEKTIVAWLNSLSISLPIDSISEINDCILRNLVKKFSNRKNDTVELLKEIFPNLTEGDENKIILSVDYLCVSTLLLIYVSLSEEAELKEVKDLMCSKLDNSTQLSIVQFLTNLQEYQDVFSLTFKKLKYEIFPQIFSNFREHHCTNSQIIGDCSRTPIKADLSNHSFDSPLQGFFQTPKRNKLIDQRQHSYKMCGDGDHLKRIKQLTDQLAEEELEKTSLHEKLYVQTQKCYEYEGKLKNKIEEINNLKEEWENESKKNEEEVKTLKNSIMTKLEYEKRLKNELKSLENYVSTLESDISNCMSKNDKLECQLQESLEKFTSSELQLKETTELCSKLQSTIEEKERELKQLKEAYTSFFSDEKAIDVSFMNRSLDKSICSPENMGVVVDKLLKEKIEENTSLQETIEELRAEKSSLMEELNSLNKQLAQKCSVILELQFLKKELSAKVENFEKTEATLYKAQNDLLSANAEIGKLSKENSHLTEKYNILSNRLQEREQVLLNCKNSKALLQINFLKLAEDFKAVQQRLEFEVKNISKLVSEKKEEVSAPEGERSLAPFGEALELKTVLHMKGTSNGFCEQNIKKLKDEQFASFYSPFFPDDKISKLAELLQNFESQIEWSESKASLQKTCSQLNDNIIVLKAKIRELEECQRESLREKLKLEKNLREAEGKLNEIQFGNVSEIKRLKEEVERKENKIRELESLLAQSQKLQEKLLLEADAIQKEAKAYSEKKSQIINEGGDNVVCTITAGAVPSVIEEKSEREVPRERQEFSDSLEEVPVTSKTFDIVNLEEKNISDKTFSVRKDSSESFGANTRSESTWVISPPSKAPVKIQSKEKVSSSQNKRCQGECWTVPLETVKPVENKSKKPSSSANDLRMKTEEARFSEMQKEVAEFAKECERLRSILHDVEQKRKKDKENFEKNQELVRQNITAKYESQLEHLKNEMKQLYNRELAKHKQEQSTLCSELRDQNKRYKEHMDELRNQLWDLREKLLQEQTIRRDLERNYAELKDRYESMIFAKEPELKNLHVSDVPRQKESATAENGRTSALRQLPNVTFPTIPTEDEEEVFDNRFLEDMKTGVCKVEKAEDRLKELQYRNSLCLPHLKSSYPGETQFHNPTLYRETDLKFGLLQFPQESQSLTDSDHSMTKSLLPDNKGKKKEQTSYKRPGPPTPSKNGGRLSFQGGDLRLTPRNVLKELNDQNERNKVTPNPLKLLLSSRNPKNVGLGVRDEEIEAVVADCGSVGSSRMKFLETKNTAPVTPRKKKFFRKPFGARDH